MTISGLTTFAWIFLGFASSFPLPLFVVDEPDSRPLSSDPFFEVLTIDASIVRGQIRSMSSEGRLELTNEEGKNFVVEPDNLVKFFQTQSILSLQTLNDPLIIFPEGDQLRGHINAATEDSITFRSPILGDLIVPLDVVMGFSMIANHDIQSEFETIRRIRDGTRNSDRLFLVNGDERDITFSALTEFEIAYLDSDRSLKVPREMVRAIGLDPALVQTPEVSDQSFDLILNDRSRLRLQSPNIREGIIHGKTTFGLNVDVPLSQISECYNLCDKIAYLTDLETPREVTVPYIGPVRSVQSNTTVVGTPLMVGGRLFFRGLGTQSRSLLAYPLHENDQRFQATLAMDDSAGPLGNVVFRVLVDGEQRFSSPPISAGNPPISVNIDVSGGKFVILATEFGQGGGVRDYAAWIEARLIRDHGLLLND